MVDVKMGTGQRVLARYALVLIAVMLRFIAPQALSAQIAKANLQPLTSEQAKDHVGEMATVCGPVADARFATGSRGRPTFLNLDQPYPRQIFTVVIWGSDRPKFGAPEAEYRGRRICVTGRIENYRGIPEIVVKEKSQISAPLSPGTTPARTQPTPRASKRSARRAPAVRKHATPVDLDRLATAPTPPNAPNKSHPVVPSLAWAVPSDCMSNCRGDYESSAESCKSMYGDDPDDADDFQTCIQDAKDEYDSCQDNCEQEEDDEE